MTTHDINFTHSIEQNFEQNVDTRYQSLNTNQRKLFRYITGWCYQQINDRKTTPFHIFLTGGAGTGKSLLIECINHQLEKIFTTNLPSAASVTVLLLAFNIHGQTIHSALSIRNTKMPYIPLREDKLNTYMLTYAQLQIIIIDEVSMVNQDMLNYISCRLQQIKGVSNQPFGNISILAVSDFYQLPPINGKSLFDVDPGSLVNLWSLLNSIRVAHKDTAIDTIYTKLLQDRLAA